jgi:cytidylate kinase
LPEADRRVPVLAVDGPSGSGKGTVARRIAERVGWHYLDSGALYRLVALAALEQGVDSGDTGALARVAATMPVAFGGHGDDEQVLLDGADVTLALRGEACGEAASKLAALPEVRAALLDRQRAFAEPPGLVADGRDMGTVVFPAAKVKVFLTASPAERARRRHKQLKQKGIDVSLRDLSRDIELRDQRDANRATAPLRPAEDARVIDSTNLTVDDVVATILAWLAACGVVESDASKPGREN